MKNYSRKETDEYGTTVYYNDQNQFHRTDGPAIEYNDGDKFWYINNKLHRLDGPAIEHSDGYKAWYINNKLHRLDGPAIEHSDGDKAWWINNKKYTQQEFNNYIKIQEAKQLLGIEK